MQKFFKFFYIIIMKDNSSGCIVRSSPGSNRSYNSTGRIRSWVNPTQGQPPNPLPPNGGQQRTRVCRSWELSCCCGSCEATKKKKKKKKYFPFNYITLCSTKSSIFNKKNKKIFCQVFGKHLFALQSNKKEDYSPSTSVATS